MGSFAVNRKDANKGTGLKSGTWFFEEFYFTDSMFGSAIVTYTVRWRPLQKSEIAEGDTGKAYQIEIVDPVVTSLSVLDDNGDKIALDESDVMVLGQAVLEAFEGRVDAVVEHEMEKR